jgi:Right handed beta helix region
MMAWRRAAVLVGLVAAALLPATAAAAHDERTPVYPDGTGSVPGYRTDGPQVLVCKDDAADFASRVAGFPSALKARNEALYAKCLRDGHRHLQAAVDAVRLPQTRILVLPGLYREEPSLAEPTGACASIEAPLAGNERYQVLTYEQQAACPHNQNLVAVMGKQDLQIEGTGAGPLDVIVDAQYQRLNAIRADRADGFYLRNLTTQRTTFNGVYILETDGFVIDRALGRWNDEYGFLTFADDHGLYTDCEAYGNGDSGVYPGAASDLNRSRGHDVDRYAIEIRRCYSHHNTLGYSGTAGDSVWAHDNRFVDNATGVATDSAFPDHPGMPQNHALFQRNVIADNNQDYYRFVRDGTCARPYAERGYENGVVCPAVGLPVGTGVINPGGNYNTWQGNWVYGNAYAGFVTSWVPGFVRGSTGFAEQFDTSHHNRYLSNVLGHSSTGASAPNGIDFWWDGQGVGSCWQRPSAAGAEPLALPPCDASGMPASSVRRWLPEPARAMRMYVCSDYSLSQARLPASCAWFGARGLARAEVRWTLGEALVLGVLLVALWARLRRGFLPLLVALAGLVVGVFGVAQDATLVAPVGLALLGLGWLGFGLVLIRGAGRPGLGWLTVALGVLALAGAVDRGIVMVPWIPVAPVWARILLELVWVPWALVAVLRRREPRNRAAPAAV